MEPLEGPVLKIARAKEHIEVIRLLHYKFIDQSSYRIIVSELESGGRYYALRVLVDLMPPRDLGLCIGEAAYQLRSALDGLVYQLALLNPNTSSETLTRTQFPIFSRGSIKGCINGIGGSRRKCPRGSAAHYRCNRGRSIDPLIPRHKAMIERLQPYHRANGGKHDPLFLLHELNNADKHRLLPVAGATPGGYMAGGWWRGDRPPYYRIGLHRVLEDGAKAGRTDAQSVRSKRVEVDQEIPALIAFWQGCEAVEGLGVTHTLDLMAKRVTEILEGFSPEFP